MDLRVGATSRRRPLSAKGWKLEAATTDNVSEFCTEPFNQTRTQVGAKQIYIRAGRPQSNGIAERFNLTMLEESWKPAFARYLTPKYRGMRLDFDRFLCDYNFDRAHSAATPPVARRQRTSQPRLGYGLSTPEPSLHLGDATR